MNKKKRRAKRLTKRLPPKGILQYLPGAFVVDRQYSSPDAVQLVSALNKVVKHKLVLKPEYKKYKKARF